MMLEKTAHTFEVLDLRCRRCGKSFRHYRPDPEMEHCDSTVCVCSGCGRLYCLSLWEDEATHEALRAIHRKSGGHPGVDAAMIGTLLPACGCGARIGVHEELCPACGSHNHVTLSVRTETQQVVPIRLSRTR